MGVRGTVSVLQGGNGRYRIRTDLGAGGVVEEGSDGTHAWRIHPATGPVVLPEEDLAAGAVRSTPYPVAHAARIFASVHVEPDREVDGERYRVVVVTDRAGQETHWLFDAGTGHLVIEERTVESGGQRADVRTRHTDFRGLDGLTIPFGAISMQGPMEVRFATSSAVHDPKITDADFAPPEAVRELIEGSKEP
jgi:hypothetical protein